MRIPLPASMRDDPEPTGAGMLMALNGSGKHIYAGTVPAHVKARRRAAGKAARAARRTTRRSTR